MIHFITFHYILAFLQEFGTGLHIRNFKQTMFSNLNGSVPVPYTVHLHVFQSYDKRTQMRSEAVQLATVQILNSYGSVAILIEGFCLFQPDGATIY